MPADNPGKQRPQEEDGKQVVVTTPGRLGWKTWFTGEGDVPGQRGSGQALYLEFTGAADKTVELAFSEPIELHDGQLQFTPVTNWDVDDRFDFYVSLPANTAVEQPGTGNVHQVSVAPGAYLYLPASGNGSHQLDLATAVPTPAADGNGAWDVVYDTGEVVASPTQTGKYHLTSFETIAYFMKGIPMGAAHGVVDVDVYRTDWVHQTWALKIRVNKVSTGAGKVGGWVLMFRPGNTPAL